MYKLKIIIISVTLIFFSSLVKGQTFNEKIFVTKEAGYPKSPVLDSLYLNDENVRGKAKFKVIIGYNGEAKSAELNRSSFNDSYIDSLCMELLMNLEYNTPYEISEGEDFYLIISVVFRKWHQFLRFSQPKSIVE